VGGGMISTSRGERVTSRPSKIAAVWDVSGQAAEDGFVLVMNDLSRESSRSKDKMRLTGW
jgi:hypothetical protein